LKKTDVVSGNPADTTITAIPGRKKDTAVEKCQMPGVFDFGIGIFLLTFGF
jgi:hypothetical protein